MSDVWRSLVTYPCGENQKKIKMFFSVPILEYVRSTCATYQYVRSPTYVENATSPPVQSKPFHWTGGLDW